MAYTQNDLSNLQSSMAKGVEEAQIGNEKVRFRSLDDMLTLERKIKRELNMSSKPARRALRPATSTGWR